MARTMVEDVHASSLYPSPPRREAANMSAPSMAYSRTALRRLAQRRESKASLQ